MLGQHNQFTQAAQDQAEQKLAQKIAQQHHQQNDLAAMKMQQHNKQAAHPQDQAKKEPKFLKPLTEARVMKSIENLLSRLPTARSKARVIAYLYEKAEDQRKADEAETIAKAQAQ